MDFLKTMKGLALGEDGPVVAGTIWLTLGLILFLTLITIDVFVGVEGNAKGTVVDKRFSPAHTTVTQVSNGNGGFTTQVINHPDAWYVQVKLNPTETVECRVYEVQFDRTEAGDHVVAQYVSGAIFGGTYCGAIPDGEA